MWQILKHVTHLSPHDATRRFRISHQEPTRPSVTTSAWVKSLRAWPYFYRIAECLVDWIIQRAAESLVDCFGGYRRLFGNQFHGRNTPLTTPTLWLVWRSVLRRMVVHDHGACENLCLHCCSVWVTRKEKAGRVYYYGYYLHIECVFERSVRIKFMALPTITVLSEEYISTVEFWSTVSCFRKMYVKLFKGRIYKSSI